MSYNISNKNGLVSRASAYTVGLSWILLAKVKEGKEAEYIKEKDQTHHQRASGAFRDCVRTSSRLLLLYFSGFISFHFTPDRTSPGDVGPIKTLPALENM